MIEDLVGRVGEAYFDGFNDGLNHAWQEAELGDSFPQPEEAEALIEAAREVRERNARDGAAAGMEALIHEILENATTQVRSIWAGYVRFCADLGVDPMSVELWTPLDTLEKIKALTGPTDEIQVRAMHDMLKEVDGKSRERLKRLEEGLQCGWLIRRGRVEEIANGANLRCSRDIGHFTQRQAPELVMALDLQRQVVGLARTRSTMAGLPRSSFDFVEHGLDPSRDAQTQRGRATMLAATPA